MKNQIDMLIELQEMDSTDNSSNAKKCNNGKNTDQKLRDKLKSSVTPHVFNLYEKLYRAREGQALAKIEDGVCGGCHVVLPTKELPFVAEAKNIVQCWNCQRILYT